MSELHTGDCPMTNEDPESRTECTCEGDEMNGAVRMFPEGMKDCCGCGNEVFTSDPIYRGCGCEVGTMGDLVTPNCQSDAPPFGESADRCESCKGRGRERLLISINGHEMFVDGRLCYRCEGTGNEISWYDHFSCMPSSDGWLEREP